MTFRTAFKAIAIIAGVGSIASASYGQYTYTPPVYSPLQAITSDVAYEGMKSSSHSDSGESASETNSSSVNTSEILYTPSKSRTRANLQNFVNKSRAVDPAGAEQMEALFASTDIIGQIGSVMANFGLSPNNAADAFALYWIAAWQAAHGDSSTPSAAMAQAVSAQAARGLSQSREFTSASDAQKQELAEALMVQAAMIEATVEAADGDKTQLKAVGKAVTQGASAAGLDLGNMTLTEEGFREGSPRKRSDASDNVGDETALAANGNGKDGNDSTNYALIAAAAGAGLGGVFLLGKAMGRKG
jgi:hypothetical protein